jgi:poly(hydroxyalkanoate) depolymerase family esterase
MMKGFPMKNLKADALRRAFAQHPQGKMGAAADLVRRTLAQHGLSADGLPGQMPGGGPMPGPRPDRLTYSCAAGTREYVVHEPATGPVRGLVLMLHGCTQTPEDFAAGTRMNAVADAHGLIVVYPAQARGANAQTCWNWFSKGDQRRGRGEPAILAGLTQHVAGAHGVPPERVFVAGLSAGAAMAVILGQSYGDVFSGVAAHSGLPYGCASDVPQAFAAMRGEGGAGAARPALRATPTIVFHGSADATVVPANGDRILRDALAAVPGAQTQTVTDAQASGRAYRQVATFDAAGVPLAEHWTVEGLGHAWSGGDRAGSYADPAGPDASVELVRFFLSLTDSPG